MKKTELKQLEKLATQLANELKCRIMISPNYIDGFYIGAFTYSGEKIHDVIWTDLPSALEKLKKNKNIIKHLTKQS
jgi:hypothetical protein